MRYRGVYGDLGRDGKEEEGALVVGLRGEKG
jgi:hypothetical protein